MDLTTSILATINAACAQAGVTGNWLSTNSPPTYVLDTNCWAYGLAANHFRSRATHNTNGGNLDGPTLIMDSSGNAIFAISAAHFQEIGVGDTLSWLTASGTTITRTVSKVVQIAGTDIWLIYLSAVVLATDVVGAVLLPSNVTNYMAFPCPGVSVSADFTNGTLRAITQDLTSISSDYSTQIPSSTPRSIFGEAIAGGASGSPMYTVINGQECLVGCWHFSGLGPSLANYKSALETAAAAMAGSSVTFSVVDLSSFDILPVTAYLTGSPLNVSSGSGVTLTWSTSASADASFDNGIGAVSLAGTRVVNPVVTTKYILTVDGPSGTTTANVQIGVNAVSTITLNPTPALFSVVGYVDSTKTWTLSGDATGTIKNNTNIAVFGSATLGADFSFLINSVPAFAAGHTTFTTVAGAGMNFADGQVRRLYKLSDADAWIGGVSPGAGDTGVIPSGATLDQVMTAPVALPTLNLNVQLGGTLVLANNVFTANVSISGTVTAATYASTFPTLSGTVEVNPGGTVTDFGGLAINCLSFLVHNGGSVNAFGGASGRTVLGSVRIESGGSFSYGFSNQTTNLLPGNIVIESGGTFNLDFGNITGIIIVESGANFVATDAPAVTGTVLAYSSSNLTGIAATISIASERRTTHFTGDITNTINILNSTAVLDTVGGTAMTTALALAASNQLAQDTSRVRYTTDGGSTYTQGIAPATKLLTGTTQQGINTSGDQTTVNGSATSGGGSPYPQIIPLL